MVDLEEAITANGLGGLLFLCSLCGDLIFSIKQRGTFLIKEMNVKNRRKSISVAVDILLIFHISAIVLGCLILGYSVSLIFPLVEVQENARRFVLSAILLFTVAFQFCAAEVDALLDSENMSPRFWVGIGWNCLLTLMTAGFIYFSDINDGQEHMLAMCKALVASSPSACLLKYIVSRCSGDQ